MNILQYSTGYSREFKGWTHINVIDQSEDTEAEISTGKNLITGEWCGSMYFCDPMEHRSFKDEN